MANIWDEGNKDSSQSVLNSGRTLVQAGEPGAYVTAISTEAITSKAYFEIHIEALADLSTPAAHSMSIGLCVSDYHNDKHLGSLTATKAGWAYSEEGQIQIWGQGNTKTGITQYGTGDIIGVAYDSPSQKCWFSVNGVWVDGGNPDAGTNPNLEDHHATYGLQSNAYVGATTRHPETQITANFGAIPFVYEIPDGFAAPESPPAISESEFVEWLRSDDKQRCILVNAQYHDGATNGTRRISNLAYQSHGTDTPAHTPWEDVITSVPDITSRIDSHTQVGQIVFQNEDGEYDDWLDDSWAGWDLDVYMGDVTWAYSQFQLIISGKNAGISAPGSNRLAFALRDKSELLDVPVQATLLANGEPAPIALGTVFNAEPVMVDSANHEYQFHEGSGATVDAVRESGATSSHAQNSPDDGKFQLTAASSGRITCDITGETDGTAAGIIEWLALRALSAGDIDSDQLADFPSAAQMGLYVRQHATIADLIQQVANSVGAFTRFSRDGKLQLVRLEAPGAATSSLDKDDIEEGGFVVEAIEKPRTSSRLGYARNWTVQDADGLAGAVSQDNRQLYGMEYSIVSATDATILTQYPTAEETDLIGTLIVTVYSAQAEANRRMLLRNTQRIIYKARTFAAPFQVALGDTVQLDHPRFGFSGGKNAVVIGMREDPARDRVELTLWA